MTDISKANDGTDLPPLAALPAFEAAARFGSFSKAAQHLGSSQPAISQHIRQLEAALGQKLFQRKSQGVVLTPAGEELRQAVETGFQALRQVTRSLRQPAIHTEITVATDFAFAAYWLLPRLDRFKSEMPAVDVRMLTAQHVEDLGGASADIAVLFGKVPLAGRHRRTKLLFPEKVYPVCAPFYAGGPQRGKPSWMAEAVLLHLDDMAPASVPGRRAERWFAWADWLREVGVDEKLRGRQLRFNNYTLVLQAAIAGQGIALGWAPLVEPLIAAGQLRRAHLHASQSARGYFLSRTERPNPAADAFVDWLQREAAQRG